MQDISAPTQCLEWNVKRKIQGVLTFKEIVMKFSLTFSSRYFQRNKLSIDNIHQRSPQRI